MAYQLNPDGSVCWHCDSAWQAAQKAAEDSARWAATNVQVSSFWKMTHSTLFCRRPVGGRPVLPGPDAYLDTLT